ncbi:MAG TPA: hypothetical protein VGD14_07730 [bacterium]
METLVIKPGIRAIVADLARQLQVSEDKVVQQAVVEYAEKIRKKKKLMSFAGILKDDEADDILQTIQKSRVDKELEPCL